MEKHEQILKQETENLVKSWGHYENRFLEDYLVTGYNNPRINMQSILTRHFLIRELFGNQFEDLMEEEIRFSVRVHSELNREEKRRLEAVPSGRKGSPLHVWRKKLEDVVSPQEWDSFIEKWSSALKGRSANKLKVLEVACGSANDYRFFHSYGLAEFLDYTGLDLAENNIKNAKKMFPTIDFRVGNALEIDFEDDCFDCLVFFDLLEHLSPEVLEHVVREICRVTSGKLVGNYFRMEDIPEHKINPIRDYHVNTLSCTRMEQMFGKWCRNNRVVFIPDFLKNTYNYTGYYNPRAYSFFLDVKENGNQ